MDPVTSKMFQKKSAVSIGHALSAKVYTYYSTAKSYLQEKDCAW